MHRKRFSWSARIAAAVLALGLITASPAPTFAQEEGEEVSAKEGRPLDGYFGTAALAGLVLFLVGKSARR
jgi:hypothetical protein